MRRSAIALSFVVACSAGAWGASGCGASASAPLSVETIELPKLPESSIKAEKTLFIAGETMSFDVSLRGVLGARAVVAVGEPGYVDGKATIVVRSQVASAGIVAAIREVRDDIESWIELDKGLVVSHLANSTFGKKSSHVVSDLGGGMPGPFVLEYTRKGKAMVKIRQKLPKNANVFDIHAILGVLRAWNSDEGDETHFFLLSGRRLWRSSLRVGVRETIKTRMGRYPVIRIDGVAQRVSRGLADIKKMKPRNFSVWLSDDADRLPLLIMATTEYGDLRVEMTEYTRPDRRITSR
ncbi:MAG: DUF3108 domain-containing protein [Kofleriaceae bacterium]|nr:DUF3108 domain-containing protein [Kofleriaceae bacterium]